MNLYLTATVSLFYKCLEENEKLSPSCIGSLRLPRFTLARTDKYTIRDRIYLSSSTILPNIQLYMIVYIYLFYFIIILKKTKLVGGVVHKYNRRR